MVDRAFDGVGVQRRCAPTWCENLFGLRAFRHKKLLGRLLGLFFGGTLAMTPLVALKAQAAELQEIQRRGYLIVAVKDNLRPLGFRSTTGQLEGLEIDVARRLAEELLGSPDAVMLQAVTNQERFPALLDDKVDVVIAGVAATDVRSRLVDFSTPYYLDGTAFVTRDPEIQRLTDIRSRPIAVLNGSSTISVVRSLLPNAPLVGVNSYQAALELLEAGQAAAFAADASVLAGWTQDYPQYRLLPTLASAQALSIAMPRGLQYNDLRQKINEAIARWQEEGWLQQRITYWGLPR